MKSKPKKKKRLYPKFEVVGISVLHANRPHLVEMRVKGSLVRELMRSGLMKIPGLRLYWETKK